MGILHDSHFWVLLATILFAVVAWKKGRAPILAMLDARTDRIRKDLEEAARLKAEAAALLADIQKQQRDAVTTAQNIITQAKETAARIQSESATKLAETTARREQLLMERIARAEAAAVQEIRTQAADLAAKSAEILLAEAMPKRGAKLVDEAIAEIGSKLN